uniref:Secreted protein n=1 Tax=Arundo donax TaxID=35708 RepID=A0A0A8ZP48_ARUDO
MLLARYCLIVLVNTLVVFPEKWCTHVLLERHSVSFIQVVVSLCWGSPVNHRIHACQYVTVCL